MGVMWERIGVCMGVMLERNGVCMGVMLERNGVCMEVMLGCMGDMAIMLDLIGVDLTSLRCIGEDATMLDLNGVPCLDKYGDARALTGLCFSFIVTLLGVLRDE